MLLVSMLVQAGDVPDATANAGSPDLCRGRAELPASRHAPVVVIVSWGICPHLGCSSEMYFKACLEGFPRPLHVPRVYGEERQGGASCSDVGVKEAFQGDQL